VHSILLFYTFLCGHLDIGIYLNVRRTGVWYLCHPKLIVPLSFFNCLLSTDSLLISCHAGVSVQWGDVPDTLSVRRERREANTGSLESQTFCLSQIMLMLVFLVFVL